MAIVTVFISLLVIPVSLLAWSYLSLNHNKVIAEKVGFPILVKWISPVNPFWMIMGSTIVKACRKLNFGTANFHRMYLFGWEGNERSRIHEELGNIFMMVTPGGNWLCVGDAAVINEVIRRPKEFRRNMEQMAVLNVYGKNLSTTDDEEWQKHRKVTSITFTEKNNELVWRESITQSKAMLRYWKEHQPVTTITTDTKVFTLNVLAAAIFNKNYPFEGVKSTPSSQDDSYQYRNSLSTILSSIVQIFVFGENDLKAWWTPNSWKDAAVAIDIFRSYILGLINEEREYVSRDIEHNQHLSLAAVHTHPQYWGDEGLTWKPERFITSTKAGIENEVLAPDTSAHFLPWAHGQRICPGKKFSQVELVAALVMLFRDHVVAPQRQRNESMEDARSRLFKTGMEINHEGTMLFEVAEPQKAALIWSKRDH
ncbi:cytochrome P450 [Massarina eburnea CBS 473.64]|uniref:Cytochrome P450 n=1 Tax=Massarina eburnea CBS 473.64 TaxID=1395130 RepID=A0A6A6S0K7_9PLEO|nr:cytochrome P450 [Massarina eburnea CBS 473.64]